MMGTWCEHNKLAITGDCVESRTGLMGEGNAEISVEDKDMGKGTVDLNPTWLCTLDRIPTFVRALNAASIWCNILMMCYISVTMSTWSPSLNIIIIITPILRCYSCLWSSSSPSDYSTIGPSTCVLGYGHAQNDLLLLSHVYSMSQNLLVVYSLYTSLYFPSFESPKFRTRRWRAAQHICWGQSPTLIQVLLLGLSLWVYICLVRISTPSKLCLSSLQVASQLNT